MAKIEQIVQHFSVFCKKYLKMESIPKIEISHNPMLSKERGTFGTYYQGEDRIFLQVANRQIMDILRTLAHELVHHRQLEYGITGPRDRIEIQANRVASMLVKVYSQRHKGLFARPSED